MKILGIDPGYAILGWGVIEVKGNHFSVVEYGAVTTRSDEDMTIRLKKIYQDLDVIIKRHEPEVMAIEELFFNTNQKTAVMVAQARGACIVAAALRDVGVFEYTPLQVKQGLVGYGRADKKQVQTMVKTILGLSEVPKPDDTADALAIAICHAHSQTFNAAALAAR